MLAIPAGAIGLSATAALAVPGASSAPPATQVVGTGGSTQPSSVQAVAATSSPSGESLPVTGGDIAGLTIIGIALVGGGTVLVRRTRARTSD
jgi:LPXTG-motif cell wall-anchored protein